MWKSTVTYGVLAFLTATSTLWILDSVFAEGGTEQVAPEGQTEDRSRRRRIEPRTATAGARSSNPAPAPSSNVSSRPARTPQPIARNSAPRQRTQAQKPSGLGLPMDVDARSLLGSAMRDAGFYTAPASTRSAIARVVRGDSDVAIVSRRPTPQQLRNAIGVRSLGRFVPAVAVHPNNPVQDLTLEQVRALLAGRVENWSQVGGPNLEVTLVLPPSDGLRNAFARALVPGDSLAQGTAGSDDDYARLRTVGQTQGAVTVVAAPTVEASDARVLTISGAAPSHGNRYPYGQELFLVFGPRPTTDEGQRATDELHSDNQALRTVLSPL